ncbi:MAG: PilW family protein [Burkholderiales bacterium]
MKIDSLHPRAARSRERGFTLIELMVGSTIALFMLIGVSELYLSSLSSEKTSASASEITTNGRYAIEVLRHELLHAGYRGLTWAEPSAITTPIGTVGNECVGAGFATNLRQGVWGANDANPFSGTCIPVADYSTGAPPDSTGTDVLVVRRAASAPTPAASRSATTLYFRSAYERGEVFKGSESATLDSTFTQAPNFDYALETNVYYVSPYTASSTETPRVPALYRVALDAGPAMRAEPVASNIEDMQLRYGRLTSDNNTRFYPASGVSTTATATTTTTATEWSDVNSVRIWILVRSSKPEPGYTNTSSYTLGDKTVTVNDGYRRELFSTVVQLRN